MHAGRGWTFDDSDEYAGDGAKAAAICRRGRAPAAIMDADETRDQARHVVADLGAAGAIVLLV